MKEELLHFVWKYKLFTQDNLLTTSNEPIQILKPGWLNNDAGPDFFNAQIVIGETKWVGNVEIHIRSSDWGSHKHHKDEAYNNVILHVVFQDDKEIYMQNGAKIPTLELANLIEPSIFSNYQRLKQSRHWVACASQIEQLEDFVINNWLDRLLYERLERKSNEINLLLDSNKNDWEQTFLLLLFKYLGLKINSLPFELLVRNTPLIITQKHNALKSIEALLFGQAGFLVGKLDDEYFISLQKEYEFLSNKFRLQPISGALWKYLRLRPNNFPNIRIAQVASLLANHTNLFSKVREIENLESLYEFFGTSVSSYWEGHYRFGVTAKKTQKKSIGKVTINSLIINAVVPLLFVYGKSIGNERHMDKALNWVYQLKPEKNQVIKNWQSIGVTPNCAGQSQALLQLKEQYCSEKKCLNCGIGNYLLKKKL